MSTKSKTSNTSKVLTWETGIEVLLTKGRLTKHLASLKQAGVHQVKDLLWILPSKIVPLPKVENFFKIQENFLFKGQGKIIQVKAYPSPVRPNMRGRGSFSLFNISALVRDLQSPETIMLKWFNAYPSTTKKLRETPALEFMGEVKTFQGIKQIVNPQIVGIEDTAKPPEAGGPRELLIQYPTLGRNTQEKQEAGEVSLSKGTSVPGATLKKIMNLIPAALWENIPETLPAQLRSKRQLIPIGEAFAILHGKGPDPFESGLKERALLRLAYEEFFDEQMKIYVRKRNQQEQKAPVIPWSLEQLDKIYQRFPYELSSGQKSSIVDILQDFSRGTPMMRLLQGDVGCGKTTVALVASLVMLQSGKQAAIMCPTEALATQHFQTTSDFLKDTGFTVGILTSSTKAADKRDVCKKLATGELNMVIGTHSLIQDTVEFADLGLVVIDEQHKFGVGQRLRLIQKGVGVHGLIMTATPIPRSLGLTQYGDLDFSVIKALPAGRKGIKTRIVLPEQFVKFLSFVKTRLGLGEQGYVVVPAIEESENLDIQNLQDVTTKFRKYFPEFTIEALHGKMKNEEKAQVLERFVKNKVNLLISTSVVEVGINVLNASMMSIINPERFGLCSLHQLRGRVGRGENPGFCFLVPDKIPGSASLQRLKVIEESTDGFYIAEKDLELRGEGDLFGTEQSGSVDFKRVASFFHHQKELFQAREDAEELLAKDAPSPPDIHFIHEKIQRFTQDQSVVFTI